MMDDIAVRTYGCSLRLRLLSIVTFRLIPYSTSFTNNVTHCWFTSAAEGHGELTESFRAKRTLLAQVAPRYQRAPLAHTADPRRICRGHR